MAKILIVEDDPQFSDAIRDTLLLNKFQIEQVYDGHEALEFLDLYKYDLIVLDWQLPGLEGPELCRQYRQNGGTAPILMLTSKVSIENKETGFDAGADDYLTKPAHPTELIARVKALLRRPSTLIADFIEIRHVCIDPNKREIKSKGKPIDLLPREFALFEFLMKHPTRVFPAHELISNVWPADAEISSEVVRTAVNRIRSKVDVPGERSIIRTVYSVGYGIDAD